MPQCILLSNVPHYHHLARALHEGGLLKRYITSISLQDGAKPSTILSPFWREKLAGRELKGIPRQAVKQVVIAELLQRGLPMTRICSGSRADWINDNLFDRLASRWVDKCDVLHFVSSIGLCCARKAKSAGARLICDVRQEHPWFQSRILIEEAERYGLRPHVSTALCETRVLEEFRLADTLVVPSSHAKGTFLAEGFASENIRVLHYGVDLTHFHRKSVAPSTFRVLYVGQITLRKGIQYLLEAYKQLQVPNSELVLIGSIDPHFLPILRRYDGIFRHVPPVPRMSLADFYSSASVFVHPSLADSFSLVTLEAMACGLPVVISENTGAADLISDGDDGFVVPIRDVEAIRDRILRLYSDLRLSARMGAAARVKAESVSWKSYRENALAIYARCLIGSAN